MLIALNTALFVGDGLQVTIAGTGMTALDALGLAIAGTMLALLAGRAWGNLRELAAAEPPAPRLR